MTFLTTSAVVLGEFKLGESDKIISLYTREAGLVRAVAKGAIKSRKRFGGVLLTGSHVEARVFIKKKTTLHRLDAADLLEPFARLSTNPPLFAAGCHLLELCARFSVEEVGDSRQFALLVSTLRALALKGLKERFLRIFEIRTLSYAGHGPNFQHCAKCGKEGSMGKAGLFSIENGSVICARCKTGERLVKIPSGSRRLFSDIMRIESKLLPRLVFRPSDLAIAEKVIPPFCEYTLGRKLRSLRMLRRLSAEFGK